MNREIITVLWRTYRPYGWQIFILVALGIVGALLDGIGINAVIPLVSFLLGSAPPADFISTAMSRMFSLVGLPFTFRYVAGFIALLFVLRAFVLVVFALLRGRINGHFLEREGSSLYAATLNASWPFISGQKLGYLQNTILADVRRTTALLDMLVQLIQSISGFIIYFLVAVNISWPVTLGTMVAGAILLTAVRPLVRKSQEYGDETNDAEKTLAQHLIEHLGGFKVMKVMGVERAVAHTGERLFARLQHASANGIFIQQLALVFFQPVGFLLIIMLVGITYRLGTFNLAVFAAVLYLIQKIFTYLQTIQSSFHTIAEFIPYVKNIQAFRARLRDAAPEAGGGKPFRFERALSFEGVSFRYGAERAEALKDISFSTPKGAVVGIIGPSGAGKTSTADLILRLYRPKAGSITLDGVPIEDIADAEWHARVGYVPQEAFLFNGTIEENIRFYRDLSSEDVARAAKQANIYDFIKGLPDGFKTVAGDRGVMLSGGQRQRVALARVLAGKPSLLVLDEATSALDHESERLIHEAIYGLRGKVTVIIIAHRLSTVAEADRIFVLEGGRLTEEGSPQELLKHPNSYYARHVRAEQS